MSSRLKEQVAKIITNAGLGTCAAEKITFNRHREHSPTGFRTYEGLASVYTLSEFVVANRKYGPPERYNGTNELHFPKNENGEGCRHFGYVGCNP